MSDESTYNNLRATTNSNNALSQQVAATSKTDSALGSVTRGESKRSESVF